MRHGEPMGVSSKPIGVHEILAYMEHDEPMGVSSKPIGMHEILAYMRHDETMGVSSKPIGVHEILAYMRHDETMGVSSKPIGIHEILATWSMMSLWVCHQNLLAFMRSGHGVHWSDDGISHDKPVGVHLGRIGVNET